MSTGQLKAPSGQITVAAVPGEKFVRLSQAGHLLSLEFQPLAAADIQPQSWTLPIASLPHLLTGGGLQSATGMRVESDRTIVLTGSGISVAADAGTAIVSGSLDVSSPPYPGGEQRGVGGSVNVLGDKVGLLGAFINASGTNGGGTVLVGGDYQGKGTVPNATQTFVSSDSTINADALSLGDGGRIIVWANQSTGFFGNISARGGSFNGNGGKVEVSGKEALNYSGTVDLLSADGQRGTLLLDPKFIIITPVGAAPVLGNSLFAPPMAAW